MAKPTGGWCNPARSNRAPLLLLLILSENRRPVPALSTARPRGPRGRRPQGGTMEKETPLAANGICPLNPRG
jgi:hypothetical protein